MADSGGVSRRTVAIAGGVVVALGVLLVLLLLVGGVLLGVAVLDQGPDVPDAEFAFDRDGEDVVISHVGGPALDGRAVWVVVDGRSPGTWADFDGGGERIREGDAIRVTNVDEGVEVRLRWNPPDGSAPRTLASAEL